MAAQSPVCFNCGAPQVGTRERCEACGAKLEALAVSTSAAGEGFRVKWAAFALGFYAVTIGLAIVVLPFAIRTYDPQGLPGLMIADALYLVGGFFVGLRAGGRAYLEPVFAAGLTAAAFVPYVAHISDVRALDAFGYVTAALIGLMSAGLGSFLGERLRGGPATA